MPGTEGADYGDGRRGYSEAGGGSGRSLLEILHQDVSLRSIRDLLQYEIIPSKRGIDPEEQLERVEDPKQVDAERTVLRESMGNLMIDRGLIDKDQLEQAKEHQKKTGQTFLRSLLQTEIALPQQIDEILHMRIPLPIGNMPDDGFTRWLTNNGVASKRQLLDAWAEARSAETDFLTHLRRKGIADDRQLAQALANQAELPYESLADVGTVPDEAVDAVPTTVLMRRRALPVRIEEGKLVMAFADAMDLVELEKMALMVEYPLQPVIAPRDRLNELLEKTVARVTAYLDGETGGKTSPAELVTTVVRGLLKCSGTDVHLEPQRNSTRVRYRVDGRLHDVITLDAPTARRVVSRVKTLAGMDVADSLTPQDGHLKLPFDGKLRDIRVATTPCVFGEKLALRMVRSDMAFCTFEQLGMHKRQRDTMDSLLALPNGMILVAGPVGSGKTTTLYSCLACMDVLEHNVMTIEDPVEYELSGGCQIQVNERQELGFANGLRAILRQDPDVILVGEIRDEETANVAVRAAMTGQLMFSTLHANSAATAVTSLLN
jgi:type IV pilus assembly protein PilB